MSARDEISEELAAQAAFLEAREPVYVRAIALLRSALSGEFGSRLERLWAHRTFHAGYERPLLLLAALRYDALSEGPTHPLYPALGGQPPDLPCLTPEAVADAVSSSRTRFERALRERFVQTNETTRAVTWLWPAHLLYEAGERRPMTLVDLGTSAGLNLIADDLPPPWLDEGSRPIPVAPLPPVALRLGWDIAPLDLRQEDEARWLSACVWPSDRARIERLEEAIALFRRRAAGQDPVHLERGSLGDVPDRLERLADTGIVLCLQTIVRDYLPAPERERYERGICDWLSRRQPRSALICELELDLGAGGPSERSAVIRVRAAADGGELREWLLARTHPHPRQLFTDPAAVRTFVACWSGAL